MPLGLEDGEHEFLAAIPDFDYGALESSHSQQRDQQRHQTATRWQHQTASEDRASAGYMQWRMNG